MEITSNPYNNKLLYLSFNQEQSCFACGMEDGFRIYNSDPLKEIARRETVVGGLGQVEMLFRCNFMALVGGGPSPQYPPTKVLIWDNLKNKVIISLEFLSVVRSVRLRRDRIVVVLENKILVYTFTPEPKKLDSYDTCDNPTGLCALCPNSENSLLAFPGRISGHVQLVDLSDSKKTPCIITAHESSLSCIAINIQGTMLATSSETGTLIRVFDTQTGIKLHELRRGADRALIYCINFNHDSSMLCVSSDKGTIHVFDISHLDKNKQSTLAPAKGYLPSYFSSSWSFAKFSLPEPRSLCAFAPDNKSIIVISIDGSFYKYVISSNGEAHRESYVQFLKDEPTAP